MENMTSGDIYTHSCCCVGILSEKILRENVQNLCLPFS